MKINRPPFHIELTRAANVIRDGKRISCNPGSTIIENDPDNAALLCASGTLHDPAPEGFEENLIPFVDPDAERKPKRGRPAKKKPEPAPAD